jgi:O-antigen ligase
MFGGVLLLLTRGIRRWIVFAILPLVANTLVLTVSRGAFLGFFSAGLSGYYGIPKHYKKGYLLLGVLGLALVVTLAHDDLVERVRDTYTGLTSDEKELDNSAVSRIEMMKAGIAIGLEHPFGAGDRSTAILSAPYISRYDKGRSAHNTLTGVFAEHGFPGLIMYVLMVAWVLMTLRKLRRVSQCAGLDELRLSALAVMAGASLVGIYVSGNFSSNIGTETQYWCLALLLATNELLTRRHEIGSTDSNPLDVALSTRESLDQNAVRKPASG